MGFDTENNNVDTKKYDRQLRLWGVHGQCFLEQANILVINNSVAASEILKNLILAGIGSYTIVDTKIINSYDISTNFFFKPNSVGEYCGKELLSNLNQLNPLVKGYWKNDTMLELLKKDAQFISKFDLIIITRPNHNMLNMILEKNYDIQCILIDSYGMVGYIKISTPELPIVESHPENVIPDLRIKNPFPSLKSFLDQIDLNIMTKTQIHKVPYIILLAKYFGEWQKSKATLNLPLTRKEKEEFKCFFIENVKKVGSGDSESANGTEPGSYLSLDASNLDEAVKAINTVLGDDSAISSVLSEVLNNPKCNEHTSFWVLVSALKKFLALHGRLPISGTIPDMTSDSESYLKVLDLYRNQFMLEASQFKDLVNERLEELPRSLNESSDNFVLPNISFEKIQTFCKNARFVRIIKAFPLNLEPQSLADALAYQAISSSAVESDATLERDTCQNFKDLAIFYLLSRCISNIKCERAKIHAAELEKELFRVCDQFSLPKTICDEDRTQALIQEMLRNADSQLITTASVLGGIASQQIIKILTKQYVPFTGVLVYEGMNGTFANFS